MGNTEVRRKSNMFKYVGNHTLYDIIGEYYPELGGDYSTARLFNNVSPDVSIDDKLSYHTIFNELSEKLLETVKRSNRGEQTKFSQEKLDSLYIELQKSDTDEEYLDYLDTLEEYIEYAIQNSNNPSLTEMREKIVNAAFEFADFLPEEENHYRDLAISLYLLAIGQQLKDKYKTFEERENPQNEEWQEFIDLRKYLGNSENRKLYDEFIENNKRNKEMKTSSLLATITNLQRQCKEIEEKQDLTDRCVTYRAYVVNKDMYDGLSLEEKVNLKNGKTKDTVSTILGDFKAYPTPPKGTYVWEFKEIEPEIILDTVADYSEGQVENQRVIAVSYGFLNYGTDISIDTRKPTRGSSYELELIGVTRKGIEGESTYFTFTTFDNTTIKNKDEIKPNDNLVIENYYFNGREGKLMNNTSGKEQVIVKSKERIPKDLEQYYAQIFFSDIYMQAVEKFYSRYSGTVIETDGTPHIVYEEPLKVAPIKTRDYLEAIRYASKYPTIYNGNRKITMESYCTSDYLKARQAAIVEDVLKNAKKTERKLESQEDDEFSL